tara:strand:- start:1643 stop:2266 length:624 start_codon:yes stop_codon:yes gene_type:complete
MKQINYFDLGLHEGKEIDYFHSLFKKNNLDFNIYGIEANQHSYSLCKEKFKNYSNIKIYHNAICNVDDDVFLYKATNNGLGDSLFKGKNNIDIKQIPEKVKGKKFSSFINQNSIDLDNSVNILKVNIEGSEIFLFEDMIENNLLCKFVLFLGTGHDMRKIPNLVKDGTYKRYLKLLKDNGINEKMYYFVCGHKQDITDSKILDIIIR